METKEGTSLRGNLNHDCARLVVAVADVDLDFDGIRFDAVDGGGTNHCEHEVLWPRPRLTATAFSENHFNHRQPRRSLAKAGGMNTMLSTAKSTNCAQAFSLSASNGERARVRCRSEVRPSCLTHGFWEAKDIRDDPPKEARKKFDLGGRGAIVGAVNTHE